MKASKLRRKQLNGFRRMGDVPWPARAYKYPPTFGPFFLPTHAAMTPRRRARAEKAIRTAQFHIALAEAELRRKQEESRAQANAQRRGLFKRVGKAAGTLAGRIFSRRKV